MVFAQPQSSGWYFKPADLSGHLILITEVHETFTRHDELAGKEKLHARFSYTDLDGDQSLCEDALSSHPGIALRLKAHAGKGTPVLGRITQEPSKKAGFNAAWVLGEYIAGIDDIKAQQWLDAQPVRATQLQSVPPAGPAISPEQIQQIKAAGIELPPGY